MAGIRGRSVPPGNQNAFRHSLAAIAQRRADGVLNPAEQSSTRMAVLICSTSPYRLSSRRNSVRLVWLLINQTVQAAYYHSVLDLIVGRFRGLKNKLTPAMPVLNEGPDKHPSS
jgi:hypothetical protein